MSVDKICECEFCKGHKEERAIEIRVIATCTEEAQQNAVLEWMKKNPGFDDCRWPYCEEPEVILDPMPEDERMRMNGAVPLTGLEAYM